MLWSCDDLGGRWSWGTGEALTFMQGPVSRRGLHNFGFCASTQYCLCDADGMHRQPHELSVSFTRPRPREAPTHPAHIMSGKYAFTKGLKEVRFLLCQTGETSNATRYALPGLPPQPEARPRRSPRLQLGAERPAQWAKEDMC